MEKAAKAIFNYLADHKVIMWFIFAVCILLSLLSASRFQFTEDISGFFPNSAQYRRINNAYTHLGGDNNVIILIENRDSVADKEDTWFLEQAVDAMELSLYHADTLGLIKRITAHIDNSNITRVAGFVATNMPFFLDSTDYARIDTIIQSERIRQALLNDRILLSSPLGTARNIILSDPLHFSSRIMANLENFKAGDKFERIGDYIFSQDTTRAVVVVTSAYPVSETMNNGRLLSMIENCASETACEFDNAVSISHFGAISVASTNADRIKKDSITAIAIALIIIIALLLYYYRNVRSILLIAVSILCGAIFAIGLLSLIKTEVSIIAIGVASIIMGLAVNYPIHILSAFKRDANKMNIIETVVKPMVTGNITTVGAFISLLFISSPAMKDLGLTAALLLVGTILFAVIFLPHMLGKGNADNQKLAFGKIASLKLEQKRFVMPAVIVLSILFYIFAGHTGFDTDMHNINYMTPQQSAFFREFATDADTSRTTLYCVAYGDNMEHALELQYKADDAINELSAQGLIEAHSGIGKFIPTRRIQQIQLERWNRFMETDGKDLSDKVNAAASELGFSQSAFSGFTGMLQNQISTHETDYFAKAIEQISSNYIYTDNNNTLIYNILTVDNRNLEQVTHVLDNINSDIFTFADKSVASRMSSALSQDFNLVLYICGFLVFAFLLLSFGRIELALIAFAPLAIAWIWILGIMGMTGIQFNIVNIILATFIFGQGDDYSIFVTEGLVYEYATGKKRLAFYKNSILLSALIMFAGIGTLILAKHPAMRSLAQVTIIGMFSVVLMSYIIPPYLFKILTFKNGEPRRMPITLCDLLKTVFVFVVFILVTIIMDIAGLFTMHTNAYHRLLCKMFRLLAKAMPGVPFNIKGLSENTFDKPCIITCNHQSHLDLLYTLMLNPKIIVLTNKWVWNCPFYGWIIRMADYLTVSDGLDAAMPRIRKMVERGYSVLVFPEGSRSADCTISHFYQGAFHLAKELNLDIRPVILHGVGHVLAKKEFVLHKGSVDITVLPPISIPKEQKALECAQITQKLYMNEFRNICRRTETCFYFKEYVRRAYMYKGAEIASSVKSALSKIDFAKLQAELEQIPSGSCISETCSGYGEKELVSALVRPDITFNITFTDSKKYEIARTAANNIDNIILLSE